MINLCSCMWMISCLRQKKIFINEIWVFIWANFFRPKTRVFKCRILGGPENDAFWGHAEKHGIMSQAGYKVKLHSPNRVDLNLPSLCIKLKFSKTPKNSISIKKCTFLHHEQIIIIWLNITWMLHLWTW
jgi:hypothetical protein